MPKHPVLIGYDASSAFGERTGIGHATARLLDALGERLPDGWRVRALFYSARREPLAGDPWLASPRVELRRLRVPSRALLRGWEWLRFPPVEALIGGVALHHSPASYPTPTLRAKSVLTVHDLCFLDEPGHDDPFGGSYFRKTFPKGLARAGRIIAVSQFTKDAVVCAYGISPEKITVIRHGVDRREFHPEADAGDRERIESWTRGEPFILCVASFGPRARKNPGALLEGYAAARSGAKPPPRLLILGHRGTAQEQAEFAAQLDRLGLGDCVAQTGYVPPKALPAFYRDASALVMPSLCEGFGLPVIEAMACGCPILAADAGALPEVAGGAAELFDPRDPASLARAIARLGEEGASARLREAGLERVKTFTWDAAARKTIEVYAELLGERP